MKRLLLALLCLTLGACSNWAIIGPGKVEIAQWGEKAELTTDRVWSGNKQGEAFLWTQEGPALQTLLINMGIRNGETLFLNLDKEAQQNGIIMWLGKKWDEISFRYRSGMTQHEVAELITTSWSIIKKTPVDMRDLEPFTLSGHAGLKMGYSYTPADEVLRHGVAWAAVINSKLFVIQYEGTAIHHFALALPEAERIIASFKVKEERAKP